MVFFVNTGKDRFMKYFLTIALIFDFCDTGLKAIWFSG